MSTELSPAVLTKLQQSSPLTAPQLTTLHQQFLQVTGRRPALAKAEFFKLLSLTASSKLFDRCFQLISPNSDGLDFEHFVLGLLLLSDQAKRDQKIQFCFDLYDMNQNGVISKDELYAITESTLAENGCSLPGPQLQALVDETFRRADTNGDGVISRDEFNRYAASNPNVLIVFITCLRLDSATLGLEK
eukprot:NODE_4661_length_757_cov_48.771429_g4501_i0.p1 GENE.NODE_4661_length_757_cov_48.771429_g4501_i0~~NODE_4661_length_757_cov_48.771429_g4501_i0.p1  ORF type:complete len:210 (-),score=69.26 NODE_4661_length_757_cov_48.771429_g4501_i0:127-693(-)